MALNGSVNTNAYNGRYYTLSWTATQSVANNQSTINWTLPAAGISGGWTAERTLIVDIAGTKVVNKTNRVERYDGTVSTGSLTLTHDISGAKSFSVSIQAAVYGSSINATGSASFTLNKIARAATITSAPNFTDEAKPIIKYSNPTGNNVDALDACISFTGAKDDIPYRAISKTGSQYTFDFTDAEKQTLCASITSGYSRTVIFYIRTKIGGNTFYSTSYKTLTLTNYEPTATGTITLDEKTLDLTGNNTTIISGISSATYAATAEAKKGATITNIYCNNGTTKYTGATGTIENITEGHFSFSATDSRGNSTDYTEQISLDVVDYKPLSNTLEATIEVDEGATAKATLNISGNYWAGNFGAVDNALVVSYKVVADGEDFDAAEWLTAEATINAEKNTFSAKVEVTGLDYKKQFKAQAFIYDEVTESTSNIVVLKTIPVFDWSDEDFNFNVPVSINNEPLADYIIEYGTKSMGDTAGNVWHWEKWASGKAVCYGKKNIGNVACTTAWYNWYETGALYINLPSNFLIEAPDYIDIRLLWGNVSAFVGTGSVAPTKDKITYFMTRPSSTTLSACTPSFYVVGRWR